MKDVPVREAHFGFLGEILGYLVFEISDDASEEGRSGFWRNINILERIELEYY